jgi:Protein of unknown function (DUF3592)
MFILLNLILVAVGIAVILRALSARADALRSKAWPSVEGKILASGVESSEAQNDDHFGTVRKYTPAVTDVYKVGSSERRGSQLAIGLSNLYSDWADAERRAQAYPVGKRIKVYYDPNGTMAVLEPGNTQSAHTMLGIEVGISITGALLLGLALALG